MSFANPTTLLLAAALAGPTLWRAATVGDVSMADAAIRYLICVPVAAIMLWLLRSVTRDFGRHPRRRAVDRPALGPGPNATPDD